MAAEQRVRALAERGIGKQDFEKINQSAWACDIVSSKGPGFF